MAGHYELANLSRIVWQYCEAFFGFQQVLKALWQAGADARGPFDRIGELGRVGGGQRDQGGGRMALLAGHRIADGGMWIKLFASGGEGFTDGGFGQGPRLWRPSRTRCGSPGFRDHRY